MLNRTAIVVGFCTIFTSLKYFSTQYRLIPDLLSSRRASNHQLDDSVSIFKPNYTLNSLLLNSKINFKRFLDRKKSEMKEQRNVEHLL